MHSYAPPRLDGHTVLYRGKRFYVFEVDAEHPFENFEAHAQVLVYDARYGSPVAFCDANLNGVVAPGTMQDSIPVYGMNPRELVQEVKAALTVFERHFMR
jgi:hypothetical protein